MRRKFSFTPLRLFRFKIREREGKHLSKRLFVSEIRVSWPSEFRKGTPRPKSITYVRLFLAQNSQQGLLGDSDKPRGAVQFRRFSINNRNDRRFVFVDSVLEEVTERTGISMFLRMRQIFRKVKTCPRSNKALRKVSQVLCSVKTNCFPLFRFSGDLFGELEKTDMLRSFFLVMLNLYVGTWTEAFLLLIMRKVLSSDTPTSYFFQKKSPTLIRVSRETDFINSRQKRSPTDRKSVV